MAQEPGEGGDTEHCDPACSPNLLDTSYVYVTQNSDRLAQWIDSFFGARNTDEESADSVLRLLTEYEWDQEQNDDLKIRLRGKVDLPRLNRRLSLVFSEDDDDRRDVLPDTQRQDTDVGLVYRVAERERSRLYVSVSTNKSLEFKSSVRYRYVQPIGQSWLARFSERVYYTEDDSFGTLSRADLDYFIDHRHSVRLTADMDYGEETEGAEWGSRASFITRLSDKEAVNYFAAVSGQTDPEFTEAYALGVRYRRNIYRPWMFVEVEPSHVWRKEDADSNRNGGWVMTLRLEFREEVGNRHADRTEAPTRPVAEPVQAIEP